MDRGHHLALLLVLLLGACLRVSTMQGVSAGDSALYAENAYRLAVGDDLAVSAYGARVGLIAPVAAAFRVFGVSEVSAALPMLLMSLAAIGTTFWLGRLVHGPTLGLIAALLLATLPLSIVQATDLHGDLPMSLGFGLCFSALLAATRNVGLRRYALLSLAAGSLAWALLCKLTALALMPAIVVAALLLDPGRGAVARTPFVATMALGVQALGYGITRGDLLFRLRAETAAGNHQEQVRMLYPDALTNLQSMFLEVPRIVVAPYPFTWQPYFGWHGLAFAAAAVWAWRRERSSEWRTLWVFLALLWLPLSFAVTGFDFVPAQIRYPRTLEPLAIPMMVIVARGLLTFRSGVRWAAVAALALVGGLSAHSIALSTEASDAPLRRAHAALRAAHPEAMVASDYLSCTLIRFLDQFSPTLKCEEFASDHQARLAIVHPGNLQASKRWAGRTGVAWIGEECVTTIARFEVRTRDVGRTLARLREGQHPVHILFAVRPVPEATVEVRRRGCEPHSAPLG